MSKKGKAAVQQNAALAAAMSAMSLGNEAASAPASAAASASAPASAAVANAEPSLEADTAELCKKECVSHITDITGTEIECKEPLTPKDRFDRDCRTLKENNERFYKAIGDKWKKYVKAILEGFPVNDLHAQHGVFEAMLSTVFPGKPILYSAFNKNKNDYLKCEDMICAYGIPSIKGHGIPLFHISLHTSTPLYMMGKTRAAYTCGAYTAGGHSSGPFHYKIDHIEGLNNKPPYRELIAHSDGTFTLSDQDFHHTFKSKDVRLSLLHEYIYIRFIAYWNRCITYLLTDGNNINSNTTPWSMTNPVIIQNNDCNKMKHDILNALHRSTIHKKERKSDVYDNALAIIELLKEEQDEIKRQKNAGFAVSQQKLNAAAEAAAAAAANPHNSKLKTRALGKMVLGTRRTVKAKSHEATSSNGTSPRRRTVSAASPRAASPKAASAAASSASKKGVSASKKKGGRTRKHRVYRRRTYKK